MLASRFSSNLSSHTEEDEVEAEDKEAAEDDEIDEEEGSSPSSAEGRGSPPPPTRQPTQLNILDQQGQSRRRMANRQRSRREVCMLEFKL